MLERSLCVRLSQFLLAISIDLKGIVWNLWMLERSLCGCLKRLCVDVETRRYHDQWGSNCQ
jgi:hypothetical protein